METHSSDASIALFVTSLVLLLVEALVVLCLCMKRNRPFGKSQSAMIERMDPIVPIVELHSESELQHLVDQQRQQIDMLQRQLAQLQQKLDQAHQALDAEQRLRKNMQQRNFELTHENGSLADEKNVLEQLRSQLEAKLQQSKSERQAIEERLNDSQRTLQELSAGKVPLEAEGDLQKRLISSQKRQRSLEEQVKDQKQRLRQSEQERQALSNRLEQYKAALTGKPVPSSAYVEGTLDSQQQHIDNMRSTLQQLRSQDGDWEQDVARSLAQSLQREIAATYEHIQDIVHSRDEPRHPGAVGQTPRAPPSEPAAPPTPPAPRPPTAHSPMRLG